MPDPNDPYAVPRGQQLGAMGDPGYFSPPTNLTQAAPPPDPAAPPGGFPPVRTAGFPAPVDQPEPGSFGQHYQYRAPDTSMPTGGNQPVFSLPFEPRVNISPAPRTGIPGNEPSGPLSGEGGGGLAARGYAMGPTERAASSSPLTGGEGGGGLAARGYAPVAADTALVSQRVPPNYVVPQAVQRSGMPGSTDASNTLAAANLAEIKARYGAMLAGQKMDEQQGLARRDQSIRENIDWARNYQGGINAFEAAGRARVARIDARAAEVFGPNFGVMRGQPGAPAQRMAAAGAEPGAGPRDYFKEAATTEDLAHKARTGVTDAADKARTLAQGDTRLGLEARKVGIEERKGASDEQTADVLRQKHGQELSAMKEVAQLRQTISSMPEGPDKQAKIKELYAVEGKAPPPSRFALAQVPYGEVNPLTGSKPLAHVVYDSETGQYHYPEGIGPNQPGGSGPKEAPTPQSIAALRADPTLRAKFEARFGPADAYLKK